MTSQIDYGRSPPCLICDGQLLLIWRDGYPHGHKCRCGFWEAPPQVIECAFCGDPFQPEGSPDAAAIAYCDCGACQCCGAGIDLDGECENGCQCDVVHSPYCQREPLPDLTCSPACKARLPDVLTSFDWRAA